MDRSPERGGEEEGRRPWWGLPLPRWAGWLVLAALFLLPALQVARRYERVTGLTGVLHFGRAFVPRTIGAVRGQPLRVDSEFGYDGQFYAQLACDPGLVDPDLARALDRPRYRARRILVPLLCWLAGAGAPGRILQACALVNPAFLALLLLLLHRRIAPHTLGQWACLAAAAWSTGVLVSIERALVDLPAAVLLLAAVGAAALPGWLLLAGAVLARESAWLGLLPLLGRRPLWGIALPLGLFAGWSLHVAAALPAAGPGFGGNLGPPLVAHLERLQAVLALRPFTVHTFFEFLAPLSLLAQAAYFALYRNHRDPWWRLGVPFALLYLCLGEAVMAEQMAFCRAVLPLTLAFNLLLARRRDRAFLPWFVAGNLGLAWAAGCMLF